MEVCGVRGRGVWWEGCGGRGRGVWWEGCGVWWEGCCVGEAGEQGRSV